MADFVIKQLPYDLSNQAGLALIGKYLKRININALIDPAFPVRSGIANGDILKSYLGLLCLGKNDFDAIESQRKDRFFARALHVRAVPSSPTLRQRLDTFAMDNSGTAKEHVGRTYAGVHGYCPLAVLPGHAGLLPGTGLASGHAALGLRERIQLRARVAAGSPTHANALARSRRLGL